MTKSKIRTESEALVPVFKGPGLWNTVPHTRRKPSLWPRSCHWPFKLWITEVTKGERCLALRDHVFFPKGKTTMTKGNPLWETSYHSRVTIQRKLKKKKSSWNWAASPGTRTARNLTGALFCSSNRSYFASSHGHRHWVKLPGRGHVHSQDTHRDVLESRTSLCATSPWKGSVTSGDVETSTRVPTRHHSENTHKCGPGIPSFTFLPHALHQQENQCWPGGSFPWLSNASTQNSNQVTSLAVQRVWFRLLMQNV